MKYVLYNPLSCRNGGKEKADEYAALIGAQEQKDVTTFDVKAFVESLNEEDEIYVCGGDGTLNRFANDVYGIDVKQKVFYCPAGTGNDFFNDVKKGNEKFVQVNEYIKNLPTVYVNGIEQKFINGVGFGLDGMCCQVADDKIAKGKTKISYTTIALKLLLITYSPKKAKVVVDGVEKNYENVWILPTMKGRFYGGGMMVAPTQDRLNGDNKVTVIVARSRSRLNLLFKFPKIFSGKHLQLTKVIDCIEGKEVYVEYDTPTALQIDGDTVRNVKSYTVKV